MEKVIKELKDLVEKVEALELFSHAYPLTFEEETELRNLQGKIYSIIKNL